MAVESEDVILSGPYELKQGGTAFSARLAVRVPDEKSEMKYIGLVSVTMNFPDVIAQSANSLHDKLKYDFILEKQLPDAGDYVEIFSWRLTEQDDFISSDFSISNLKFRLSVVPQHGWYDKSGAFVMMDLDNFKSINDILGHQTGDEVLVTTAAILKSSLRDTDIVARLGGDEFMMYIPFERGSDFLEQKLEDIRIKMHRDVKSASGTVTVSSSIGVSIYNRDKDFDTLYKEADEALYKSKEKGKNRITVYGS